MSATAVEARPAASRLERVRPALGRSWPAYLLLLPFLVHFLLVVGYPGGARHDR